jgi:hypothetical protein
LFLTAGSRIFFFKRFINSLAKEQHMGFIGKLFAIVMFPLGLLIILEATGVWSLKLPFDKILLGALLMIILQLITLFLLKMTYSKLGMMNFMTATIFILTALAAIFRTYLGSTISNIMPLILGVMMFVEALYALH